MAKKKVTKAEVSTGGTSKMVKHEVDLARDWIKRDEYQIPERMPNIDALYNAGAEYVSVDSYDDVTGRMVLGIMFPEDKAKVPELWLHIANCDHDGVKFKYQTPLAVRMLILDPEEYIELGRGPNAIEVPIEW